MYSGTNTRWLICRICLKIDGKELYTIYGDEEDDKTKVMEDLKEKIEQFGGIEIEEHSKLPNKICNSCLLLLRACCKFRDLCSQSQVQLQPFRKLRKSEDKQLEVIDVNVVTHSEMEEDDECLLMSQEANELHDFVADEKQRTTSPTDTTTAAAVDPEEPSVYDIKQFINDVDDVEEENATKDVALSHEADHLVDEDSTEYIYDPTNESSQDTKDQLITNDSSSNPYDIDQNNLHVQYYDVCKVIDDTKFTMQSVEVSDLNEEIDNTDSESTVKVEKRKRRESRAKAAGKIYNCSYCDNVYQDKAKYAMHIKMHKQVKPHECEICGKRFSTTPQLSRHMNSHTGNRPYKCKYCEACFGDPSTRIKHERIHTNERPYKCALCPKSFAYSNVLKVHMMVHTGERPHICAFCDKAFSQIHHKNAHEKRHRSSLSLEMYENDVDIEDELKEYEIEKL